MSWGRIASGKLAEVKVQVTDTRIPVGGVSAANVLTKGSNVLSGSRMWDKCSCIVDAYGLVSGTWEITVDGTVMGISGLPLAKTRAITATALAANANGKSGIVLASCTNTSSMLSPDSVNFDNTSAGGFTGQVVVIAKTNRGQLPGGTLNSSRVQEGVLISVPALSAGTFYTAGVTQGVTVDTTVTLANTSPDGTTAWGVLGGLGRLQMWDTVNYWMDVTGASGTWDVYIQSTIPGTGNTVTIAGASGIGAGTFATGATKIAFRNVGSLAGLRPTQILFDGPTGVSSNIAGTIVYAAKATRGQKRGYGR